MAEAPSIRSSSLSGRHTRMRCSRTPIAPTTLHLTTRPRTVAAAASNQNLSALPGGSVAPHAAGSRSSEGGKPSPLSRTFSPVMQTAMRIPGLASALNLISSRSGSKDGATSSAPTVAAAGINNNGHAEDYPLGKSSSSQAKGSEQSASPSEASGGSVYGLAAAAANGHSNGYANGHAARNGHGGEVLTIVDPVGRVENNIAPYTAGGPSLASQIREIATTLRHINTLRIEYMEKIAQQEMELSTKDQALRNKEERIHSLEHEAEELRRSLALLHNAKAAAEAEVQRLRAAAAAAPALPVASPAQQIAAPAAPAPVAAAPAAAAVAPAPVAVAPAPVAAAPAPPAPAPPAPVAAPPAAKPPPPPPRVPEIIIAYRSGWNDAFLQCNIEGKGWTSPPGLRMEHTGNKEHVLKLQAKSMEFVVTNGKGEWDTPAAGGTAKNYRIDSPGEYRLHYGALSQIKAWQP